jgi:hypothetical protein
MSETFAQRSPELQLTRAEGSNDLDQSCGLAAAQTDLVARRQEDGLRYCHN